MPVRVLEEGLLEVWVYPGDSQKVVRCFFAESEMEVDINLLDLEIVQSFGVENRAFLWGAKRLVTKERDYLLAKWDELNS